MAQPLPAPAGGAVATAAAPEVAVAARPAVVSLRALLGAAGAAEPARPAVASLRAQRAAALALAVDPATGAVMDPAQRRAPPLGVVGADELRRARGASAAWAHRGAAPVGRAPDEGERVAGAVAAAVALGQPVHFPVGGAAEGDTGVIWPDEMNQADRAALEWEDRVAFVKETVRTLLAALLVFGAPLALFAGSLSRITAGSCALKGGIVPPEIVVLLALTSGLALALFSLACCGVSFERDNQLDNGEPWYMDVFHGFLACVFVFMLVAPCVALGLACNYHCDPGTIAVAATLVGLGALVLCIGFVLASDPAAGAPRVEDAPDVEQQLDGVARAAALPYHTAGPRPPSMRATTALVLSFSDALRRGEARADAGCVICFMDEFLKDDCVVCLSCGSDSDVSLAHEFRGAHVFHKECLITWFSRHSTCPLCRAEVRGAEAAKFVGPRGAFSFAFS